MATRSNQQRVRRAAASRAAGQRARVFGLTRRAVSFRQFTINDAAIAPGTSRLTDLGAAVQNRWGEDILGCKVGFRIDISVLPGTVGVQSYTAGVLVGPDTLDAADLLPATVDFDQTYSAYRILLHRGQSHDVAGTGQFDELHVRMRVPARLIRDRSTTIWLVEETVGQTQSSIVKFDARVWLP